jgi:hypothetical protein
MVCRTEARQQHTLRRSHVQTLQGRSHGQRYLQLMMAFRKVRLAALLKKGR